MEFPSQIGVIFETSTRDPSLSQINRQYEQIMYFGDGSNDFCVSRSLRTKDIVFPRKGFRLVSILEKEPISAQVIPWRNGKDVMNKIENI